MLLVLWNVYCQYWITSYNLEKYVDFVKSNKGQVEFENFKLNHRKRNHYCIYLGVSVFFFCYSLLVATTYIEIGVVGSKLLIIKDVLILVTGVAIWTTLAYFFYKRVKSINDSV